MNSNISPRVVVPLPSESVRHSRTYARFVAEHRTLARPLGLLFGLLFSLIAITASASPGATGLLWRVTAPDGAANHLFGTMHSADPRVTQLAAPVAAAFDEATRVVLELDMRPATMAATAQLLMLRNGGTLQDAIPPSLYREVIKLGTDKGLPEASLAVMKPWAVGLMLATPPQKRGEFLDKKLATMARESGKPIVGLETPDEQLSVFDGLSSADQLQLLTDIIAELDQLPQFYAEIEEAYMARDLDRILALGRQDLEGDDARLAEILLTGLIDDRNQRMAERLDVLLRNGDSFIAVGALHLPGEQGLIALLRARGYQLARIW